MDYLIQTDNILMLLLHSYWI